MSWSKSMYGWAIALLLYTLIIWNLAGRYFRQEPAPKGVVVDTIHLQPDFVVRETGGFVPPETTTKDLARGSLAIDTLTEESREVKPQLAQHQQPPEPKIEPSPPCAPFTLRLVSRGFRPVLDSTVLNYSYPSGLAEWTYFGASGIQKPGPGRFHQPTFLVVGVRTTYQTLRSAIILESYAKLQTSPVQLEGGYRMIGNSRPSWFVGVSREWKVF